MASLKTMGILLATLAVAACSGVSLRPHGQERTSAEGRWVANYTVTFFVSCDDCRVSYGKVGETFVDAADGDWSRSLPLGTLRDDQRVRILLQVQPRGDATVVGARIAVNGETVRSGSADEPGEQVTLRARVGGTP